MPRKIASGKVLCNRTFDAAKNLKYNGYQHGFASMVYDFFNNTKWKNKRNHRNS